MNKQNEITTKTKTNGRVILTSVMAAILISGMIAGLTLTSTGRAITFAVADPGTVNRAADMKAEYVQEFELTVSPKE